MLSVVTCGTGNQKPEKYVLVPPNNAADVGETYIQLAASCQLACSQLAASFSLMVASFTAPLWCFYNIKYFLVKTNENPVGANGILWESDGENEYVNAASGGENEYVNAVSGGENEYKDADENPNEYRNDENPVGAHGILWESDGENEDTNEPHNKVVSNTGFVPSGKIFTKKYTKSGE